MPLRGSGWKSAGQPAAWLVIGALLFSILLAFLTLWGSDRLPPYFPPELEAIDQ